MDEKEILMWIRKAKDEKWDGLDLSKNHISRLPPQIGELEHLSVLDVSNTGLEALPPEIGQLSNLRILKAAGNRLFMLPEEIGKLKNLMSLDLSNNRLIYIPTWIGWLTNLRELNLSDNRIKSLRPEIGQLPSLAQLDISYNAIDSLPPEIGQLIALRRLRLFSNLLRSLPIEIGQLTQLVSLELHGNHIETLPIEIGELTNLTVLSISRNLLSSLPVEIGQLTQLTELNLNVNHLDALPIEIMKLNKLKKLQLAGNPLLIPPEILERDPQAILDYYFSRGKKPLNEIKLLVVGQGSVGKTSLIGRILEDRFDPTQNKTEGIEIRQWEISGSDTSDARNSNEDDRISNIQSSNIKLNVWDFGGQEIMHATHQFFLTRRSIYLLVLDARLTQEENRVEYWLKIIQSFGGDSPVLVVGNKTDQHPLDLDRTGLQKKYPNIVAILETSAASGAGVEALKAEIARQVETLPHVRDRLPEAWFSVKAQLEELGQARNFITQDEYLGLCAANEVRDASGQRTLIGFLHDLGVVLHFQDDPRLEALGILNPQWVTNGVYKLLNARELFDARGRLTLALLNRVLDLPEYPANKRLFIVDMMKKFELCYDIHPDKSFLVPDLLPKDQPDFDLVNWQDALAFEFHYNVLPSSIITRFIVRMNTLIGETVWRSGVALTNGDNAALVQADTEERKVYIRVGGEEHKRRDFLAKIRGEFDAIHATISKLEVREMVPVPGHPEAEPVDFDLLLQLERNGVETYPVLSDGKMVLANAREMLNGVESETMRQQRQRGGNVTHIHIGGSVGGNVIVGDENG